MLETDGGCVIAPPVVVRDLMPLSCWSCVAVHAGPACLEGSTGSTGLHLISMRVVVVWAEVFATDHGAKLVEMRAGLC